MGKIFIMTNHSGGSGGADTSVVTATASDVLVGKIIVNADGEPISGTMANNGTVNQTLSAGGSYTIPEGYHSGAGKVNTKTLAEQTIANATANQILSGSTAWVNGTQVTGTMTNQGSKSSSINAGGSYTIPAGYHDGTGKVTGNALSSQTSGTAAAGDIIKNRTAWVNGSQVTGTMTNHGAITQSLNCGGSYTIPAGYHNGSGKVTANSLASQTSATAAAGDILSGKTAYVNGSKVTGSMATLAGGTYTPSTSQQKISCSGKKMTSNIVINAIPSKYVDLSAGASFFKNGAFGVLHTYLGLASASPSYSSNKVTGYTKHDSEAYGSTITNGHWCRTSLEKYDRYYFSTKKGVDFTNVTSVKITFKVTGSKGNRYICFWAANSVTNACESGDWVYYDVGEYKTITLNVSSLTGQCLFGFYIDFAYANDVWHIQELSLV